MITIFGARGQLGSEILRLAQERGHAVQADPNFDRVEYHGTSQDVWINCVGVLRNDQYNYPPHTGRQMVYANAMYPWELAHHRVPLIHVSTDSVFNGSEGLGQSRAINEVPQPTDLYGRTKLVGEGISNFPHCTVVRTSFLGPRTGLLRMAIEAFQKGEKTLTGHCRSYWSGSTVYAVAEALLELAVNQERPTGIQHLATLWPITKADVLQEISDTLGLHMKIEPLMEPKIHRGLTPTIQLEDFHTSLKKNMARYLHENTMGE